MSETKKADVEKADKKHENGQNAALRIMAKRLDNIAMFLEKMYGHDIDGDGKIGSGVKGQKPNWKTMIGCILAFAMCATALPAADIWGLKTTGTATSNDLINITSDGNLTVMSSVVSPTGSFNVVVANTNSQVKGILTVDSSFTNKGMSDLVGATRVGSTLGVTGVGTFSTNLQTKGILTVDSSFTNKGMSDLVGAVRAGSTIDSSSTIGGTGFRIGAVAGKTVTHTNVGAGWTNVSVFVGGILTNDTITGIVTP